MPSVTEEINIMIQSLPWLQIIYGLLLFQPLQVFCVKAVYLLQLERTAKQIFGYDFSAPLKKGDVLIWKISGNSEPFAPLKYSEEDVKFGSNETYVLTTQKPENTYTIYYWLGGNTSLVYKMEAVKYAMRLTTVPKFRRVLIARETEGMESDSFQHTMNMFNGHAGPRMEGDYHAGYLDLNFILPRPNLYVVRGERYSSIKKIPLSLGIKWLKERNLCLVLEAGYEIDDMWPSNYYCGAEASNNFFLRTQNFAHNFGYYNTYGETYEHKLDNDKRSNDFKKFLEVFEDSRYYNPNEVDDSGDHLKTAAEFFITRNNEISLFDVTYGKRKEYLTGIIHSFKFLDGSVRYLLDTKSVAGIFLLLSRPGDTKDIMISTHYNTKATQLVEKYMDEKYPLSSEKIVKMRVLTSYILDFSINLADYPDPLMRTMAGNELR